MERGWGGLCGEMAKVLDCVIVVSKFKHRSRYYVNFQTNSFGKSMNYLIPLFSYELNDITTVCLFGFYGI